MQSFSLTIVVTVYNHEKFLKECFEGIIKQETTFPFKVIVGEDCSTDNSRKIVEDYHHKFPNIFDPIYFSENVGAHQNFITCINKCQTTWIAFTEGDDFWIDPHKLQKQAELLQANPEATLCFSSATSIIEKDGEYISGRTYGPPDNYKKLIFERDDFLVANFVPTSSIVFKREAALNLPDWHSVWHLGDWTLYLHLLEKGYAVFLDDFTSCYRRHDLGSWSKISAKTKFEKQIPLIQFLISEESSEKSKKVLYLNLLSQQIGLLVCLLRLSEFRSISRLILRAFFSLYKSDLTWKYIQFYFHRLSVFLNYEKN